MIIIKVRLRMQVFVVGGDIRGFLVLVIYIFFFLLDVGHGHVHVWFNCIIYADFVLVGYIPKFLKNCEKLNFGQI